MEDVTQALLDWNTWVLAEALNEIPAKLLQAEINAWSVENLLGFGCDTDLAILLHDLTSIGNEAIQHLPISSNRLSKAIHGTQPLNVFLAGTEKGSIEANTTDLP